MVILLDPDDGTLVAHRPTVMERLMATCRACSLDRQLARGVVPESQVHLALRAHRLVQAETRGRLARRLEHLLEEASCPRPATGPRALMTPRARRRVRESRIELTIVIEHLKRPAPIPCRGLAQVCVLLRDGAGPLYAPRSARELKDWLYRMHVELQPISPCTGPCRSPDAPFRFP